MPRKTTKKSARDRADSAMSLYIRKKYARGDMVQCITCDIVKPINEMHCAHFIERGKAATRFVEENCHPACPSCNQFRKEHHMREYTLFMIDTYGREKVEELRAQAREIKRYRLQDYLDIEAYYKERLKDLDRSKADEQTWSSEVVRFGGRDAGGHDSQCLSGGQEGLRTLSAVQSDRQAQ